MAVIINEQLRQKAEALKKPLKETVAYPVSTVKIAKDDNSFQGLTVTDHKKAEFPVEIKAGDEMIFDFGDHFVGYLSISLINDGFIKITDSPVKLHFTFGEFPLEIETPPEEYKGSLGCGWLQNEERAFVFTPCTDSLSRRYSFRYLKIKRTDTANFPVKISALSVRAVSAVSLEDSPAISTEDELLKKIYTMSVKTLKECEQDVYEDGPKRDRRLWIGDLKLQALTDYGVFKNYDLIKRCILLFASVTADHGMVAPCIFPDSPPYVDEWTFCDYSLFFIACLYDWHKNTGDITLVNELYDTAYMQMTAVRKKFNKTERKIELNSFIDWCPGLDKQTALLGVYIYTLKMLKELGEICGRETDETDLEIKAASACLLSFFDEKKGVFLSNSGQISQHSQVWAILSGELSDTQMNALAEKICKTDTEFTMRTPYMMHYYLEALHKAGRNDEIIDFIKEYWGKIAAAGFDCCPEIFNPSDAKESPYHAPEINSACHAWSCTPAYWLQKLL